MQRIKNEFTVEVYEVHARIALEAVGRATNDVLTVRKTWASTINVSPCFVSCTSWASAGTHKNFWRIAFCISCIQRTEVVSSPLAMADLDMATLLAQLTPAEKADPGVHHALQTAAALATSNYVRFFRLYNDAPNMAGYIMDHFVERERMAALAVMSRRYADHDQGVADVI